MGFGAEIESKNQRDVGELFAQVLPEDLLEFGLIPEFIGRLPVISQRAPAAARKTWSRILTEPKNALTKQYQKFFAYDGVELIFAEDALEAIADHAILRETGARGLRSIIESALMNVMFELPSRRDVTKCVVTREVIEKQHRSDPGDEHGTRRAGPRTKNPRSGSVTVAESERTLPLLATRDLILFPEMLTPIFVGREKCVRALEQTHQSGGLLILSAQKLASVEEPGADDIYSRGHAGQGGAVLPPRRRHRQGPRSRARTG